MENLYFPLKMLYLGILKKVIPCSKSAPSNSSKCEVSRKKNQPTVYGPKMTYLGVFKLQF